MIGRWWRTVVFNLSFLVLAVTGLWWYASWASGFNHSPRWDSLPVHYCVEDTGSGFVSNAEFKKLTDRAFAVWGMPAVDDGACRGPIVQGDHVNEIGWGTPPGAPLAGTDTTGVMRTMAAPDDPVLAEADIIIEPQPPPEFRTAACLYSTLLHETGHFIGILKHIAGDPVMKPVDAGDCPTALSAADYAAVRARYGSAAHPSYH